MAEPTAENDRPICPTCRTRKVRSEDVWWCAMCDDCPGLTYGGAKPGRETPRDGYVLPPGTGDTND